MEVRQGCHNLETHHNSLNLNNFGIRIYKKKGAKQKQTTALHQGWKLAFRYILIINERLNQN